MNREAPELIALQIKNVATSASVLFVANNDVY